MLCPIIQTADYPINLAAIKMQTKVVERITKESLLQLLVDIIPGLLQVRCCGGPTWDRLEATRDDPVLGACDSSV